ncbi:MAG: hypothetical protein WEB60_09860 [Terrimicrobiaceae bacterium]
MRVFVFALPFEAAGFRSVSKSSQIWILGVAGISCAPRFEDRLDQVEAPSLVVSAGLAGALEPGLSVGDLVVGENSDPSFVKHLFSNEGPAWRRGFIHTVDSIVSTPREKALLAAQTGAIVCDMESARIAEICEGRGIPFAGVRAVSDTREFDMPVPPQYLAHPNTGKPDVSGLLGCLLRKPSKIPKFFQMVRDASRARRALHDFLSNLA